MKKVEKRLIDVDILIGKIKDYFDCDYGEQLINPICFLDLVEEQEVISTRCKI